MKAGLKAPVIMAMLIILLYTACNRGTASDGLNSIEAAENHLAAEIKIDTYGFPVNMKQIIELNGSMGSYPDPDSIDNIEFIGWSRNGLLAYRYFTPAGGYGGWNHNFVILNTITDEIIGHSSVDLDKEDMEFYRTEYNSSLENHTISGRITDPSARISNNSALKFPFENYQCWFDYDILDDDTVEWKLIIGDGTVQKTITEQKTAKTFLHSIRILGFYKSPFENRIAVLVSLVYIYPSDESFSEGRVEETVSFTPMLFGCNMEVGFAAAVTKPAEMPPQIYAGRWGSANNYLHILNIYNEAGHREINFFWSISERVSTRATALIQNNRIVFDTHDDTGHVEDYVYYAVRGTMNFGENGIFLAIERSNNPMIRAGETFLYSAPVGFVRIESGSFAMASLSGFFMGQYPVSQAEYETIMGVNPSELKGPDLPAGNISWFDATEYCNRLSERDGLGPVYTISGADWERTVTWNRSANGYRLPTEAEWEYAWRAGTITPINTVLEWCWDWFGAYPNEARTNPAGPASGSDRVLRGGPSSGHARQPANRHSLNPHGYGADTGFRLVRPLILPANTL